MPTFIFPITYIWGVLLLLLFSFFFFLGTYLPLLYGKMLALELNVGLGVILLFLLLKDFFLTSSTFLCFCKCACLKYCCKLISLSSSFLFPPECYWRIKSNVYNVHQMRLPLPLRSSYCRRLLLLCRKIMLTAA